jgi:hypothetical protein
MSTEPTTAAGEESEGLPLSIKLLMLVAAIIVAYVLFVDVLGFLQLL